MPTSATIPAVLTASKELRIAELDLSAWRSIFDPMPAKRGTPDAQGHRTFLSLDLKSEVTP
jgi:hypothetical protein